MMGRPGRPPALSRQAGVSLMELLVALAILALAMSTFWPGTSRQSAAFETRRAASELENLLREARVAAREENLPVRVVFDAEARQFTDDKGGVVRLPERVSADLVSAASVREPAIVFLPDGASTGGAITLYSPAQRHTLTVDWLTSSIERSSEENE